ncbi:tyrosine-type recombinase/integrase [Sunxiuqinia indica]|uniref:tyrosine-type recombinase/integrase n=1 Tax=Sunxiuqinia indica TaxID=2692584 RepID=UPI001357F362|nr:tyrosine-type recombinase/integrase [Sunxiuqinia indica]
MNFGKYVNEFTKDLEFKNYSKNTIENYASQVKLFLVDFTGIATKPSEVNQQQIKEWIMQAKTTNTCKQRMSALKLFYKYTIKQPRKFRGIEYPRSEKHLPQVIDKDLIIKRINQIKNIKHKAILSLAFSVGLRVSEVVNLKIEDIDSTRMIIHIKNAKGRKDRIVPLSMNILNLLRAYFKIHRPKVYLFNGQTSLKYSVTSCQKIFKQHIDKKSHFHILRHSSFTALLETGTDLRIIQKIAGHASSKTTEIYTHVTNKSLSKVTLPI